MNRTIASKPILLNHEDLPTAISPAQRRAGSVNKTDDSADSKQPKNVAEDPDDDGGLYTVDEVSRWAGLSRARLYRMIRDGEIEARLAPIGPRKWLIPARQASPLFRDDPFE